MLCSFYACGVSRVRQEFELFEQIEKNTRKKKNIVLILKEVFVDSYFDDPREGGRYQTWLLLLFYSLLFSSSLLWRHAEVLVDLSATVGPNGGGATQTAMLIQKNTKKTWTKFF